MGTAVLIRPKRNACAQSALPACGRVFLGFLTLHLRAIVYEYKKACERPISILLATEQAALDIIAKFS